MLLMKEISYGVLAVLLGIISFWDIRRRIIPNKYVLSIFCLKIIFLAFCFFENRAYFKQQLVLSVTGLFISGFFTVMCRLFSKDGIGMGDIKLLWVLGFFLGTEMFMFSLVITSGISFITALVFIFIKKSGGKTRLPFAQFISFGTAVSMLSEILTGE